MDSWACALTSPVVWFLWGSLLPVFALSSCCPKWLWGWQTSSPPEPGFTWGKVRVGCIIWVARQWAQFVKKVLSVSGPRRKAIYLTYCFCTEALYQLHQGTECVTGGCGASRAWVRVWPQSGCILWRFPIVPFRALYGKYLPPAPLPLSGPEALWLLHVTKITGINGCILAGSLGQ